MVKKIKKEQLLIGTLIGILVLVIAIPVPKTEKNKQTEAVKEEISEKEYSMEAELKEILQRISGVGRTEVFITYEDEGKIVVEKDESVSEELIEEADSSGGTRTTTSTRNEKATVYGNADAPYVIQELSPTIKGILVVAEGGGNVTVKKQIQETIEALFGLDSHKISIMKMEVTQ